MQSGLMARLLAGLVAVVVLATGGAQAATVKETGQWILNVVLLLILLGAALTYWVVKRYRPS